jgi:hypothetical protein
MINQIEKYDSHIGGEEVTLKKLSIVSTGVLIIRNGHQMGSDQSWRQSIIGHQNPIRKLTMKRSYLGFKFRSSSYLH